VRPASLTANNSTKDFTISGAGSITGGTGLTKNGSGKLTLGTTNSFTGPVAINCGTVSVATLANSGTNSGLGAGTGISLGDASNLGTLQYTARTTSTNRPDHHVDGWREKQRARPTRPSSR
jgi:autotransporter-associated beta strand protein